MHTQQGQQFQNICVWSREIDYQQIKKYLNLLGFLFIFTYPCKISEGLLIPNNGLNQR